MYQDDTAKSRSILALGLTPALLCISAGFAYAQDGNTTNEFWPEADLFFTAHPNVRLILSGKQERDAEFRNREIGGDLELSFHRFPPALHFPWLDLDATRRTLISIRAGYRYKRSFDTATPVHENRPTLELTLRWVLRENILVSSRGRLEFRYVDNSPFSWRYRNQLKAERDFELCRYTFTSYVAAEPFYNSKTNKWDRFRFSGGVVLPLRKWLAVEPYYLLQIVTDSQPRFTNAFGFVVQVHAPK